MLEKHTFGSAPIEDSDYSAHSQSDQNLLWTHFGLFLLVDSEYSDWTAQMRMLI